MNMLYVGKSLVKQHVRKTKTGKVALVHQYTNANTKKNDEVLLPEEIKKYVTNACDKVFLELPNLSKYLKNISMERQDSKYCAYTKKVYYDKIFWRYGETNVFLNEKYFGNIIDFKNKLVRSELSGFHPKYCDNIESVIVHELGHVFYNALLFKCDNIRYRKIKNKAKQLFNEIEEIAHDFPVSQYAKTNRHEAVAEMFAKVFIADNSYLDAIERRFKQLIKEANSCLQ